MHMLTAAGVDLLQVRQSFKQHGVALNCGWTFCTPNGLLL
jgi:hypothetical protein